MSGIPPRTAAQRHHNDSFHEGAPSKLRLGGHFASRYQSVSSASGAVLGAVRRNFMSPSPVASPARFLKKSAAVSTTPTFSATAAAIHWFNDTPSSFSYRPAAFLVGGKMGGAVE